MLATKPGPVCIQDEVFSCFLSGDEISIRYPTKQYPGANRDWTRLSADPDYLKPSAATEKGDADYLKLLPGVPKKPAEVAHGLSMELLFSSL